MSDIIEIVDKISAAIIPYQALLFALILFLFSNKENRSKRILGYYMILNVLMYSYMFFYYSGFYDVILIPYYFIIPIVLLIQPFFFFYIKSLTKPDFKCTYKQLFHFLPSLIFLIMNISLYSFLSYDDKINLMSFSVNSDNQILQFFLQMHLKGYHLILSIQAIIYISFVIIAIYKYKKQMPANFSNFKDVNLNWLIILLVFYLAISTLQESLGYIDNLFYDSEARIWFNLFMIFTLAYIGISGLRQKEIFITAEADIKEPQTVKYEKSSLKDDVKNELITKLKKYLNEEKPYLNNDLKLDDIANKLETNRQYLSQIINETYKQNFFTLINNYRINEAKKLFFNQKHKQLSIMGVANSVGFNSKSTFNTLFKKFTGKTPSQFISENNL
jgi:AraC-like DNA-binding protein